MHAAVSDKKPCISNITASFSKKSIDPMPQRTEALTADERAFLQHARRKFEEGVDWLEFEDFAFGSRSPLYAPARSHQDVLQHPLYVALKEMWLDLGVRQGRIAVGTKGETRHAPRGEARGGGEALDRGDAAKGHHASPAAPFDRRRPSPRRNRRRVGYALDRSGYRASSKKDSLGLTKKR